MKGEIASLAGAVGMILANDVASMDETIADPHILAAANIKYSDGQYVYSYIKKNKYFSFLCNSLLKLSSSFQSCKKKKYLFIYFADTLVLT